METGVPIVILLLTSTSAYPTATTALYVKCPVFVVEGKSLDCECLSTSPNPVCTPQWTRGQSERWSHSLLVPHVTRQDNGTRFTCWMDCNDQKHQTHYILQVAYGPTEGSVRVHGPPSFLADGKSNMTLTCSAGDVNPQPLYRWSNAKCENLDDNKGRTCTFVPTRYDDGENITCTAVSAETLNTASADFTLNLTYPPPHTPQFSGYISGQPVKSGDNISCSAAGGKPLVSTVNFSCSDQVVAEATVEKNETLVTRKLRLNVSESQVVQCTCSAVWEPQRELYPFVANDTIKVSAPTGEGGHVQDQKKGDDSEALSPAVGPIFGGIVPVIALIIVLVLVFFIFWRKRKIKIGYVDGSISMREKDSSQQVLLSPDAEPQPLIKTNDGSITVDKCDSGYCSIVDLKDQCAAVAHASVSASDVSGSCPTVSKMNVRIKHGASKDSVAGYTEVSVDCPEPNLTTNEINPYGVADVTGSEIPEPQACSPEGNCQSGLTTPVVNPYSTVNVTDSEYPEHKACCPTSPSEHRLPAPKPCFPTSHSVSFGVNSSITRKPGPLGDPYTLVDKKKGCLPIIHEEKGGLLEKISAQDDIYDKLNHAGKSPSPHRFEESPYNRRLSVF